MVRPSPIHELSAGELSSFDKVEAEVWTDLFDQISGQHQNLSVRPEALHRGQIPNALLVVFGRGHDLQDVEGSPGHVMTHHLEVAQLEQGGGLEICFCASALRARSSSGMDGIWTNPCPDCGLRSDIP